MGFAASPWTEGKTYGEKVKGKLDFGVKNLLGGWTEIFSHTMKHAKAEENKEQKENIGVSLLTGIVYGAVDTVGGALHAATFVIPEIDVPLPENGVQF